jgi:hypothetical protein
VAIKRFIPSPEDTETSYRQILFENFGVTVYYAQLFEGTLQLLLTGMKRTSLIQIDPSKFNVTEDADGIIDSCIGPLIKMLEDGSRVDLPNDFCRLLKKANQMRNRLVHRFLAERADELVSEAGQIAVTDELFSYYRTIRKAHTVLVPLVGTLLEMLGVTAEDIQRRKDELMSYAKRFPDISQDA